MNKEMEKAINEFPGQFKYNPEIKNGEKLSEYDSYIIGGMGGSGLVAGILRAIEPGIDIAAHHEYGLPKYIENDSKKRLFIAISYSGNTEETIDFFSSAIDKKFPVAVISTGGKLLELADEYGAPYIKLPDTGIQPRMSLGFMLRALLKLVGNKELFDETEKLSDSLEPDKLKNKGVELADELKGSIPVIYGSRRNQSIVYNWKIKFNETGKIPSFYNIFPELNHNEMTGFDIKDATRGLSEKFKFILLKDSEDDSRIRRRMEILEGLYKDRGLEVLSVEITGANRMERIFSSLITADWTAYHTALNYGVEPEQVPMVEEFKKLIL